MRVLQGRRDGGDACGKVNEEIMREELLTRHEMAASLRAAGCEEIDHVRVATLENNGQITFSLRTRPDTQLRL